MSKKDGKATLLNAELKKDKAILAIPESEADFSRSVAADCPVKIIQIM
jgi:ferredoxin